MDCIPPFKAMQECFEKHSELFAEYLRHDDHADESGEQEEEDQITGAAAESHVVTAEGASAVDANGEVSHVTDEGTSMDGPEKEGVSVEDEHTLMEVTSHE